MSDLLDELKERRAGLRARLQVLDDEADDIYETVTDLDIAIEALEGLTAEEEAEIAEIDRQDEERRASAPVPPEPEPAHGYRQDAGYVQEQQQAFDGTGYLTEDTYPVEFAAPEPTKPDMVDDLLPLDLTLQSGETGGPAPTPEQEEPEADAGIFETLRDLTPEPSLDLEPTPDEQRLLDALEAQKEPA